MVAHVVTDQSPVRSVGVRAGGGRENAAVMFQPSSRGPPRARCPAQVTGPAPTVRMQVDVFPREHLPGGGDHKQRRIHSPTRQIDVGKCVRISSPAQKPRESPVRLTCGHYSDTACDERERTQMSRKRLFLSAFIRVHPCHSQGIGIKRCCRYAFSPESKCVHATGSRPKYAIRSSSVMSSFFTTAGTPSANALAGIT